MNRKNCEMAFLRPPISQIFSAAIAPQMDHIALGNGTVLLVMNRSEGYMVGAVWLSRRNTLKSRFTLGDPDAKGEARYLRLL